MGEGPKLKLIEKNAAEFTIEGQSEVRVKFQRAADGTVVSVAVLLPDGNWENSVKSN